MLFSPILLSEDLMLPGSKEQYPSGMYVAPDALVSHDRLLMVR
jgi:hypothetical protein